MWHYSDAQRLRQSVQTSSNLAQSTYDQLLGLRGMAITLLFLDLSQPDQPVAQVAGLLEDVTASSLVLGLAAPLPPLDAQTRFGVEVMPGAGLLRFQTKAHATPEPGATRLTLSLPRQVESVQRRKFSRAPICTPVVFAPGPEDTTSMPAHGGIGRALDLSAGGMRFTTQTPLKHGQRLLVSFNTPDGASYRGVAAKVARVVWDKESMTYTAGLQFTEMTPEAENQLVQSVFRSQLRGLAKR